MDLGTLAVKLKADLTNFTANMTLATGKVKDFAAKTTTYMAGAAAAVRNFSTRALASVAQFASRMTTYLKWAGLAASAFIIKIGSAAEESENLFEVSFENMSGSVRAWSEELAERLKVSAHSVRQYAGNFQLFLTGMEVGADKARLMSQRLTELVYDISSLRNVRFDETLRKVQAALAGEVEPLRRLGITVNETTLKLWAQKQGLDTNVAAWTEQQKVIARYAVILQGTTKDVGDMERTQRSVTNLLRSTGDQFKELAIAIYEKWKPHIQSALETLRDWLAENRDRVADVVGGVTDNLATFAAWLRTDWAGAIKGGFEILTQVAQAVLQSLVALFEHTFKYIASSIPGWLADGLKAAVQKIPEALKQIDWKQALTSGPFFQLNIWEQALGKMRPDAASLGEAYKKILSELSADVERVMAKGRAAVAGAESGRPVEETTRAFRELGDQVKSVQEKTLDLRQAFQEAGQQGQQAATKWKAMWADASSSIAGSMRGAWADIMMDAKNATEYLTSMVDQIVRAVHEAFFTQYLMQPIFGAINAVGIPLKAPTEQATAVQQQSFQPVYQQYGGFQPKNTDTIPAMISPGEAVLPERVTSILRDALGAEGGLGGGSANVTFNVQALDAASVYRLFNQHGKTMAQIVANQVRTNSPIRRSTPWR